MEGCNLSKFGEICTKVRLVSAVMRPTSYSVSVTYTSFRPISEFSRLSLRSQTQLLRNTKMQTQQMQTSSSLLALTVVRQTLFMVPRSPIMRVIARG